MVIIRWVSSWHPICLLSADTFFSIKMKLTLEWLVAFTVRISLSKNIFSDLFSDKKKIFSDGWMMFCWLDYDPESNESKKLTGRFPFWKKLEVLLLTNPEMENCWVYGWGKCQNRSIVNRSRFNRTALGPPIPILYQKTKQHNAGTEGRDHAHDHHLLTQASTILFWAEVCVIWPTEVFSDEI